MTTTSNDAAEMANSAPYFALSPTARKILAILSTEIERHGAPVRISHDGLANHDVGRNAVAPATRELSRLGFIKIISGRTNAYHLSNEWRDVTMTLKQAKVAASIARATTKARPAARVKVYRGEPAAPPKPDLDEATRLALRDAKGRADRRPATSRLGSDMCAKPAPVSLAPLAWPSRSDWERIGE
jgi:hypothetical protein